MSGSNLIVKSSAMRIIMNSSSLICRESENKRMSGGGRNITGGEMTLIERTIQTMIKLACRFLGDDDLSSILQNAKHHGYGCTSAYTFALALKAGFGWYCLVGDDSLLFHCAENMTKTNSNPQ